ncbi:MAG TPA: DUF6458 family protein [Actinoplanes sp.]|nr:DUF6458 family protein [Actinoplanes sp.]
MGIGGSIFLIALGAILTFAVNADIGVLDLSVVGWVLMIAGFAGLVITIWFWQNRRRAVGTDPAAGQGQVVGEYREVRREQPPL